MRSTGVLLSLLVLTSTAAADIVVKESGGVGEAPSGAPATVTFQADEKIVVRQVKDESQAFASSNTGATVSAYADTSRALCMTPCTLEMPAGFMRIRFGDANPMNANSPIDFNFKSGPNAYRIQPFQRGKFTAGFLMAILGGSAAIIGTTLAIVQSDNRVPMGVLAGVGIGVTIGGAVMIVNSKASAESIPAHDPSLR
jgi:hypothetical protein